MEAKVTKSSNVAKKAKTAKMTETAKVVRMAWQNWQKRQRGRIDQKWARWPII